MHVAALTLGDHRAGRETARKKGDERNNKMIEFLGQG
jgi:hypothetical protein